ncbi:MAG: GNAT family N-acetyltransferase [Pseudomonadales bacterium]|nr:GNAT family N-acetyltransferase [Pseudomonadales bacterium]
MAEPRIYIRDVKASDRRELLALNLASRELHYPWISPPLTPHMFKVYLRRTQRDDHAGYAICLRQNHEIVGVININNIVQGALRSASVGYYVAQAQVGQGYMREGLTRIKEYAFGELGLHRLEANIQPANKASIRLVRSCGFVHEGLSRQFLYIEGAWRDHERWAAIDDRVGLT